MLQAGRKDATVRVSRRGQSIQSSFSRLLLFLSPIWRTLHRLPASLLVEFLVSSTHLLTDVQLLISQPSSPSTFPPFFLPDAPSSRQVSVLSRCTATVLWVILPRNTVVSIEMPKNETKRIFIRLHNSSSTGGKYIASLNERTFVLRFFFNACTEASVSC